MMMVRWLPVASREEAHRTFAQRTSCRVSLLNPGMRMFGCLPGCSLLYRFLLLLSALASLPACVHAQSVQDSLLLRDRYGLYIDLGFNHHLADFRALPGVPNCCPQFQSGNGVGASFGLL